MLQSKLILTSNFFPFETTGDPEFMIRKEFLTKKWNNELNTLRMFFLEHARFDTPHQATEILIVKNF